MNTKRNQMTPAPEPVEWIKYLEYSEPGNEPIPTPGRYAVLLVLKGFLCLSFENNSNKEVAEESLVVIDQKQLTQSSWSAGMAMLVFTPPDKIFNFFHSCSHTFSLPSSAVIPLLPELQQWADDLMLERLKPNIKCDEACRRDYCVRLTTILQHYPPVLVGELLVAFHACSISGKKKCRGKVCR